MKISTCHHCNKVLAECETVWSCGPLFCSKTCGISWAKGMYEDWEYASDKDLTDKAAAYFTDIAEEVDLETIGITTEVHTTYDSSNDITTIFHTVREDNEELFTEVTGFYFGPPTDKDTEKYDGDRKAVFYRCEDLED